MKVLFNVFDMEIGGVERSLLSLLTQIDKKEIYLCLNIVAHKGELLNEINIPGVEVIRENKKNSYVRESIKTCLSDGYFQIAIRRVISRILSLNQNSLKDNVLGIQNFWKLCTPTMNKIEGKYDIAISYTWPHDFVLKKVDAVKKVAFIHTDFNKLYFKTKHDYKIWSKFDQIVAVSEECKNQFLKVYPSLENVVTAIDNIVDIEYIKDKAKKIDSCDKLELMNTNKFKIITIARFAYAKGIDIGIRAIKHLVDSGENNMIWYIVGYGMDEHMLRNQVKELSLEDNIVFLGKCDNPYPYLDASDLYMQPSRYEGRPVTITEAFALNKPCLVTNFDTVSSLVNHEVNGYIVSTTPEDISKGIKLLMSNRKLLKSISQNRSNIMKLSQEAINKMKHSVLNVDKLVNKEN